MEQKLIMKNEKQCIYFMKETNLDFYFIIPNSKNVRIVLGIFDNVTDEFVKSIPFQVDKAVVLPVINNQVLAQVNILQSPSFKYLDQVLSFLINTAYKMLNINHIAVDSKILLNYNSKYDVFHQAFVTGHHGRVESFDLFPKVEAKSVEIPTIISEPVQQPTTLNSVLETNIEEVIQKDMDNNVKVSPMSEAHEPGFVSYILLGVLVAVLSLVFLYFIL